MALIVRSRSLVVIDVNFNLHVLGLVINFLQATDRTLGLIEQADGAVEAEHRVLVSLVSSVGRDRSKALVTAFLAVFPRLLNCHLLRINLVFDQARVVHFGQSGLLVVANLAVVKDNDRALLGSARPSGMLRVCEVKAAFAVTRGRALDGLAVGVNRLQQLLFQTVLPAHGRSKNPLHLLVAADLHHALVASGNDDRIILNDSELEELFDLKYIEEKLMLFDYDSYTNVEKEKIVEDFVESEKDEEKGPIIICVDTSGSMSGAPERIAKAIVFCISSKAISENRPCLLINFSTSIEVIEFNKFSLFTDILNFLKKSFNGGTDLIPALKYSLDKMESEKFEKADVLILSDFILNNIGNEILEKINNTKILGNKFYSISIGNLFMDRNLNNIFTKQWVYNPNTSNLDLLNEIAFYFDEKSI